jgi:hypothetical protein
VKIISRTGPPPERVYLRSCLACGALIEFTSSEATLGFSAGRGDYYEVQCPACDRPGSLIRCPVGEFQR